MTISPPAWPDPKTAVGQAFFSTARLIATTLRDLEWTRNGYLAAVSRAGLETSFVWDVVGDNNEAHGIAQWHDDRIQDILKGCGIDVRTAGVVDQCKAIDWETKSHPYLGRGDWMGCPTPMGAGIVYCVRFEGAGAAGAALKTGIDAENWSVYFAKGVL